MSKKFDQEMQLAAIEALFREWTNLSRETADEMIAIMFQHLREGFARRVEQDLVCPCRSYEIIQRLGSELSTVEVRAFRRSSDYHDLCYYAQFAAEVLRATEYGPEPV